MALSSAASTSARIEILRLVLILAITCVHIPFDDATSPYRGDTHWTHSIVLLIRDGFGRLGVPLLSIVSGYLAAGSTRSPARVMRGKVDTLLIPFLVFNIPLAALVAALQLNGSGTFWPRFVDGGALAWADAFFALTDRPVNQPLYFLRDLLLCFLLLPLLVRATRLAPAITLAALTLATALNLLEPVVLSSRIMLCFALGIALRQRDFEPDGRFAMGWWALPALFAIAVAYAVLSSPDRASSDTLYRFGIEIAQIAMMVAGAIVCWSLSGSLLRSPVGSKLSEWGDYSFLLFLTHQPLGVVLFIAWMKLSPDPVTWYWVFYIAAPILCFFAAMVAQRLGRRHMPKLFGWMTGKRQARR